MNHLRVGDDALRDRLREGLRAAHGQDYVAHFQLARIAPSGHGQGDLGMLTRLQLQFQHADVGHRIGADSSCLDLVTIGQVASDPNGLAGDVMVRDYISVGGDDCSATGAPLPLHPPPLGCSLTQKIRTSVG